MATTTTVITSKDAKFAKTVLLSTRIIQLILGIILLGALSYIIDEIRDFAYRDFSYRMFSFHSRVPREVVTPEVFSLIAILSTTFGIVAIFFLGYYSLLVAAALDFIVWIGYIASIAILRYNFPDGDGTPLEKYLNLIRRKHRVVGHEYLNGHLVRLIVAFVVIQIILYFSTIVISVFVAKSAKKAVVISDKGHLMTDRPPRVSFSKESRLSNDRENVAFPTHIV